MKEQSLSIPIAIVIAGIIIAGAVYVTRSTTPTTTNGGPLAQEINIKAVSDKDHIYGNPKAPIVIVEYSDTECPFCKQFHSTMRRIVDEYAKDGKVAWVYRHFPIDQLHSKARKEAEATECANELGGPAKFWEYINRLFEVTPSNDGLDAAELPKIAEEVGLKKADFSSCLLSGRHAATVEAQYQEGVTAGSQGTPYSVLITKKGEKFPIEGAQSYATIKSMIDAILNE